MSIICSSASGVMDRTPAWQAVVQEGVNVCGFVCVCVCVNVTSVYMWCGVSGRACVCLCLPVSRSVCLTFFLCPFACLYVCLSVYLSLVWEPVCELVGSL